MPSALTVKYILGGLAGILSFSGSVYFIIKQAKNTETAAPPISETSADSKSDQSLDIFDILKKTFSISLSNIDNILQFLQQLKDNESPITLQDINDNKDKLHLISKLLKECENESKKNQHVCQQAKKPNPEIIKKILKNIDKIEEIMGKDKDKNKELMLPAVNTFVALEALNNPANQKSQLTSFLKKLQEITKNKNLPSSNTDNAQAIEQLLKTYSKTEPASKE